MAFDYYNSQYGIGAGYRPAPQTMPQQFGGYQPQQTAPPVNQLIWVQGETGAKAYGMPPGSTVILLDSEQNRFYIKSTDNAGMPTLKAYEYAETAQKPHTDPLDFDAKYVTREEFKAFIEQIKKGAADNEE